MILPGHVAAVLLASEATGVDRRGALAASMFPDLVDKPLRWLFAVTPNDRVPAHTAIGLLLTGALARRVASPRVAQGWVVGYATHLYCDEINSYLNPGRIYLCWPFRRYRLHRGPTGLRSSLDDFSPLSMVVEGGMLLLALIVFTVGRGWRPPQSRAEESSPQKTH